jgi:hypothetical protein
MPTGEVEVQQQALMPWALRGGLPVGLAIKGVKQLLTTYMVHVQQGTMSVDMCTSATSQPRN